MDFTDCHQAFADHSLQHGQERLDSLGNVHEFDVDRQVLAQLQQARGVHGVATPKNEV